MFSQLKLGFRVPSVRIICGTRDLAGAEKESLRTLSFAGVLSTNPRPCEQTYGAGKTTTMRIPPGLVMLDSGTMRSRPPRRISNRAQQDDWPERPFAPTITAAVRAFSLTPVSLSVTTGQGADAPGSRTHVPGARPPAGALSAG